MVVQKIVQKENKLFNNIQFISKNKDDYGRAKQSIRVKLNQQAFLCKSLDRSLITNEGRCLLKLTKYLKIKKCQTD